MGRSSKPPRPGSRRQRRRVVPLEPVPPGRMRAVFALLCLGLFGLMGRMAWLQVFQATELEARARSVQTQRTKPLGTRRPIVDRTGRLVALDEERYRLWLHPRYFNLPGDAPTLIRPPSDVAARLAPLLSLTEQEILKRMGDRPSGIKLIEGLDPETASTIRSAGISGVDLESYPHRVYPQGDLFANVVGFLNQDREPQAGLE